MLKVLIYNQPLAVVETMVRVSVSGISTVETRVGVWVVGAYSIAIGAIEEGRISLGSGLGLSISRPGRNISFKQSEVRLLSQLTSGGGHYNCDKVDIEEPKIGPKTISDFTNSDLVNKMTLPPYKLSKTNSPLSVVQAMMSIRVSIAIGSVASIGVRIGAITIGEPRVSLSLRLGLWLTGDEGGKANLE